MTLARAVTGGQELRWTVLGRGRGPCRREAADANAPSGRNGDPGGATSIVARTVEFTGNANLGSNPLTKTFGAGGTSKFSLVQ